VGIVMPAIYVALQQAAPVPIAAGTSGSNVPSHETRMLARMIKHPSGERPREVTRAVIGGSLRGGLVPSATVDELVFGSTTFGEGTPQAGALQGAGLVLTRAMSAGGPLLRVRAALGALGARHLRRSQRAVPRSAAGRHGLLRIGSEILAYDTVDVSTGTGHAC
jgi:hypothetical protein